ncbi:MAG: hypothetical protein GX823_00170 [Clostridiales bacterium]|nr:hypothetical protein [Clostridiales bacterium]
MKNKYLIRMENPEDCLIATDGNDIYYRLFHAPVTAHLKNEMDCMQFHTPQLQSIPYHEHTLGTETFIISQGRFRGYCMGQSFDMRPGDMLHIQPWMGHGFLPLEPESRLNILFMGFDYRRQVMDVRINLMQNFPGVDEDMKFREMFELAHGILPLRTLPVGPDVPAERIQQLRRNGTGIREHEFEGIKMQLKVARYETEGVKEIWELFMKPGFYCEWDDFLPEYRMFYVTSGKIRFSVKTSSTETLTFDAEKENIVTIPQCAPFGFEVIEEARMYDLDCSARLQDLCEEYEARSAAGTLDKQRTLALCREFGLNCTDFGCK